MSLNKLLIILLVGVFVSGVFAFSTVSDQFADAGSRKKIHFTQTIESSQDPGQGHENHQLALILSPNEGTIYDGSMTFTASKPVQIVVLHEILPNQATGQPTWTVDGETIYGLSLIDTTQNSGSFEFTGAALALHSPDPKEFTATVSIDGWIRGQPTEIIMQKVELEKEEPKSLLSRTNVPATIPMHNAIYDSKPVLYIITDSSSKEYAQKLTEIQDWKVEIAPPLQNTPKEALQTMYVFTNGEKGDGLYGFQNEVFSATPSQESKYSALSKVVEVSWKRGQNEKVLESAQEIIEAEQGGRIEFKHTEVVLNTPQIVWPDGQLKVRSDKTISDDMEYGGGQITEINQEEMTVTFVAHRGWGPDGETIYYIVTDATPSGPAEMMGVSYSPTSQKLATSSAAVDLFQFKNGIKGTGPLGFQPGIAASAPGDDTYSPMWRIFMVEWHDPNNAKILETKADIDAFSSNEQLSVILAKPMNQDHIVNCPFIDPFQ